MRTRDHLQEYQYDMGTAGTVVFNLDYSDLITEISLLIRATNGATSNKDNPIERNITKIEVVDGGTVLWDLPGDVAYATYCHLKNGVPDSYRTSAASDGPYVTIPVFFGRGLYDPAFAFNPKMHRNPQLKITFDEATVRAAGNTGYVSDSFDVSVLVKLMEDATPPVGFLSCRDVYQYTSLASGDTRVEMPNDKRIRMLMLRAYESAVGFRSSVTRYKLSVDGGKFIPFDLYTQFMLNKMTQYFQPITLGEYAITDDPEWHENWMGIAIDSMIRSHQSGVIAGASSPSSSRINVYHISNAGASVDGQNVHFSITGYCMHNTLLYPFGDLNTPDDWFDPVGSRQLDLFLTNGNAGAEVNVCAQQLYPY